MSKSIQTREQLILCALASRPIQNWNDLESRAESLPAMLMRHGALPVKLFLLAKGDSDKALWNHVEAGIKKVLPDIDITPEGLAKLSFEKYLLVNEVAVEVSALFARWVKVHTAEQPEGTR